jgi:hypothetical protein
MGTKSKKSRVGIASSGADGKRLIGWTPPNLRGKVVVVAGASRGAGRGIALALGECGATVYVTARTVRGGPVPPDGELPISKFAVPGEFFVAPLRPFLWSRKPDVILTNWL